MTCWGYRTVVLLCSHNIYIYRPTYLYIYIYIYIYIYMYIVWCNCTRVQQYDDPNKPPYHSHISTHSWCAQKPTLLSCLACLWTWWMMDQDGDLTCMLGLGPLGIHGIWFQSILRTGNLDVFNCLAVYMFNAHGTCTHNRNGSMCCLMADELVYVYMYKLYSGYSNPILMKLILQNWLSMCLC